MTEQHSEFAPADDLFVALESILCINDDLPRRQAAREQMERQERHPTGDHGCPQNPGDIRT